MSYTVSSVEPIPERDNIVKIEIYSEKYTSVVPKDFLSVGDKCLFVKYGQRVNGAQKEFQFLSGEEDCKDDLIIERVKFGNVVSDGIALKINSPPKTYRVRGHPIRIVKTGNKVKRCDKHVSYPGYAEKIDQAINKLSTLTDDYVIIATIQKQYRKDTRKLYIYYISKNGIELTYPEMREFCDTHNFSLLNFFPEQKL